MRAEPRRKNHTIGSKWLRSGSAIPAAKSGEKEEQIKGKTVTENHGSAILVGGKEGMVIDTDKGISQGEIIGNALGDNIVAISQQNIIQNKNILAEKLNDRVDEQELNIVDPKRRRTNAFVSHITEPQDEQVVDNSMEINDNPKNLLEAGAVPQPRLGL
ncbi:hypothetical protein POM88_040582 [Heracleum sosnowskyi]|nr:hypothetical protein POM88_040582 [Heracleum sosnowskyi]